MGERTYQARVEIFPKPEVATGREAALSVHIQRQFPELAGTTVLREGKIVEFDITARRKATARRRAGRMTEELLANSVIEDGELASLEFKKPLVD